MFMFMHFCYLIIHACCSVRETDWSLEIADIIVMTAWKCPNCEIDFNLTGIQKLQHMSGKEIMFEKLLTGILNFI